MDKLQIEIELAKLNGKQDKMYKKLVLLLIRRCYTLSDELSLGRQMEKKPEEWAAFDAYCEQCKAEAKALVYGA